MAKKSFNIGKTLKKNQNLEETTLPKKVVLKRTVKDIDKLEERVNVIHDPNIVTKPAIQESIDSIKMEEIPTKIIAEKSVDRKALRKAAIIEEKIVRLTIDTPTTMHKRIKIKSIEKGVSMRDYVLRLIEKDLKRG